MSDQELLEAYRPVLVYDSRERYYADAASTLVENDFSDGPSADYWTRLMRGDRKTEIASVRGEGDSRLSLDFLRPGKYPNGQDVKKDDCLVPGEEWVADARRMRLHERHASRAYGAVRPGDNGARWLQYWFFYFASAKGLPKIVMAKGLLGLGLHEGDWEMVQFRIPPGKEEPDAATFAAHGYAHKIPFEDVERDTGHDGAPLVYVALNSHASYPTRGKWRGIIGISPFDDYCDGDGRRERPALEVLGDDEGEWLDWSGRWGSSKNSPQGPAHQRKWKTPDSFHRKAHDYQRNWEAGLEEATAPEPVSFPVDVTCEGSRWSISFEIPDDRKEQWAGVLTLLVNDRGDGPPVSLVYDEIDQPGTHESA